MAWSVRTFFSLMIGFEDREPRGGHGAVTARVTGPSDTARVTGRVTCHGACQPSRSSSFMICSMSASSDTSRPPTTLRERERENEKVREREREKEKVRERERERERERQREREMDVETEGGE